MKRTFAVILAIALLLGSMTFASAEGDKVKLTGLFIAHPLTKSVYDMNWLMEIEEAAGVEIEWEQIYTDWNQIFTPRPVLNDGYNPSYLLDYYRFVSDSACRFAGMQADILRRYKKPGDFITTNGLFNHLDNHRMAEESLDVYCYDSYPSFAFGLDRAPKTETDLNASPKLALSVLILA